MKNSILDRGGQSCSGCGICSVICDVNAIKLAHNKVGFLEPTIDENICVNCGLCKQACYKYVNTPKQFRNYFENKKVYGAWSKNVETRKISTSGGIGHELSAFALRLDYKVCGVDFDPETGACCHIVSDDLNQINRFRGSKYLQSDATKAFKSFAKDEKYIVIGTPCQIYGLRQYLIKKKWEERFILIDFFCHGVPTSNLYKKYLKYIKKKHSLGKFKEFSFRSKSHSKWHRFGVEAKDTSGAVYYQDNAPNDDHYFHFFLSDVCLRKSCYKCLLRLDMCSSDIRLADFWGPKYQRNDEGVSLVAINTLKGERFYNYLLKQDIIKSELCTYEDLKKSQWTRFLTKEEGNKKILSELSNCSITLSKTFYRHLFVYIKVKGIIRLLKILFAQSSVIKRIYKALTC
jgi:coenzyme F420-reducing hydrogenase beta subunit